MSDGPTVPNRSWIGLLPGSLLGLAAGLLLSSIWLFADREVALAVSAVFAGLVSVLMAGVPGLRPFAVGLLASAVVAGGALAVLTWYADLGS